MSRYRALALFLLFFSSQSYSALICTPPKIPYYGACPDPDLNSCFPPLFNHDKTYTLSSGAFCVVDVHEYQQYTGGWVYPPGTTRADGNGVSVVSRVYRSIVDGQSCPSSESTSTPITKSLYGSCKEPEQTACAALAGQSTGLLTHQGFSDVTCYGGCNVHRKPDSLPSVGVCFPSYQNCDDLDQLQWTANEYIYESSSCTDGANKLASSDPIDIQSPEGVTVTTDKQKPLCIQINGAERCYSQGELPDNAIATPDGGVVSGQLTSPPSPDNGIPNLPASPTGSVTVIRDGVSTTQYYYNSTTTQNSTNFGGGGSTGGDSGGSIGGDGGGSTGGDSGGSTGGDGGGSTGGDSGGSTGGDSGGSTGGDGGGEGDCDPETEECGEGKEGNSLFTPPTISHSFTDESEMIAALESEVTALWSQIQTEARSIFTGSMPADSGGALPCHQIEIFGKTIEIGMCQFGQSISWLRAVIIALSILISAFIILRAK